MDAPAPIRPPDLPVLHSTVWPDPEETLRAAAAIRARLLGEVAALLAGYARGVVPEAGLPLWRLIARAGGDPRARDPLGPVLPWLAARTDAAWWLDRRDAAGLALLAEALDATTGAGPPAPLPHFWARLIRALIDRWPAEPPAGDGPQGVFPAIEDEPHGAGGGACTARPPAR